MVNDHSFTITYQDQVLSLFDHYHKFTVEEVIEKFELRCDEPAPEIVPDTQQDTEMSAQLRFGAYDNYEFDDFDLSRLVVESLISSALMEQISTKYSNDEDYGEDVTELATEALCLIQILLGLYALPLTLGSTLVKKVTNTSSEFFNRKMFVLLDEARTLETNYKLLDPTTMSMDPQYTTYGPYAVCVALQEGHGRLISDSDWPALATKLPESNVMPTNHNTNNDQMKPSSDLTIQCFKCKQFGHKANNPACPMYGSKQSDGSSSSPKLRPKDPWKYIEPRDLTTPVEIDGKRCFFCTKCRCRATGRVGFYQLSHTDSTHDSNWKPEGNITPIEDPDPTPSPPLTPSTDNVDLHDDLVFTGVNCAPVVSTNPPCDERENIGAKQVDLVQEGWKRRPGDGRTHTVDLTEQYRQYGVDQVNCVFPVAQPCTEESDSEDHHFSLGSLKKK